MITMLGTGRKQFLLNETMDSMLKLINQGENRLAQFQSLPLYRKLQRPNLNNEKLKSISEQLELEEKAKVNLMNRIFKGSYIFNVNKNPFTDQFKEQKTSPKNAKKVTHDMDFDEANAESGVRERSPEKDEMSGINRNKVINIIDEIRKYKNRKVELRGNMSKPLRDMMQNKLKSIHDISAVQPIRKKVTPIKIEVKVESPKEKKQNKKIISKEIYFEDALEFNQIINLKDKSYFLRNQKIGSIFKFAFDRQLINAAGRSKLDTYYFCHNSMKDVAQKRKFMIYRDISRFSRHMILQILPNEDKSSLMELSEANPTLNEPTINTILSISAGRLKPDELLNVILSEFSTGTGIQDEVRTTSIKQKQIFYQANTKNVASATKDDSNTMNQAREFLSLSLGQGEMRYSERLKVDIDAFKKSLNEQKKILSMNILDKQLYGKLNDKSKSQIQNLFFIKHSEKDKDRLIRKNKMFKDRYEELKVKSLIEVAKIQRDHQKTVASKYASRSKSKTPTKSTSRIK